MLQCFAPRLIRDRVQGFDYLFHFLCRFSNLVLWCACVSGPKVYELEPVVEVSGSIKACVGTDRQVISRNFFSYAVLDFPHVLVPVPLPHFFAPFHQFPMGSSLFFVFYEFGVCP